MHQNFRFLTIQKAVEFLQLSAFPLPSDPAALGLAPRPRSVKEDERAIAVTRVELFDAFHRDPEQFVVFRHFGCFCVGEVRQQRETEVSVADSLGTVLPASRSRRRIESGVSSIIGTTTSVRQSSGMPSSNDIFGSTRGGMTQVSHVCSR